MGIDALRFAAAVLVVAYHYCFLMGIHPSGMVGSVSQRAVAFPELYDWTHFGWIGVQIFFVISGLVIAFSGEKATPFSFLQSRIVRLGPAVWICAPITLAATMLVAYMPTEVMYRAFRHSMFFLPWSPWIDGSYWTLGIEIAFYAAVLAVIRYAHFGWVRPLAILMGVVSSVFWCLVAAVEQGALASLAPAIEVWRQSRALSLLLVHHGMFFAMGVLLWAELIKQHRRSNCAWIAVFCLTGCMQIVLESAAANASFGTAYAPWTAVAIWLLALALIVASVRYNNVFHRLPPAVLAAVKTAGMMTYPLYLLHQIVGGAIMGALVLHGVSRWTALAGVSLLVLVVTWVVATQLEPRLQAVVRKVLGARIDRDRWLRSRGAR